MLIQAWIDQAYDEHGYTQQPLPSDWPLEVWQVLIRHFPDLRYWAAHQPHCPEAIIRALAAGADWRSRFRVAERRDLPTDLFEVLARDRDEAIRRAISCNQKAPLSLVEVLSHDPVESVARVARSHLEARLAKLERQRLRALDPDSKPRTLPPRLWVLLARDAPTAVVLRRGPSKQAQLVRWDLEEDRFEAGPWLRGRVDEYRCHLSPSGDRLVYFAGSERAEVITWTAVCRPPSFAPLSVWPLGEARAGGGVFEAEDLLMLNHPRGSRRRINKVQGSRALGLRPWRAGGRSFLGPVFAQVMALGGWQRRQSDRGTEVWARSAPTDLGRSLELCVDGCGRLTYGLWFGGARTPLAGWTWADWCPRGDLLWAREGRVFRSSSATPDAVASAQPLVDLGRLTFEEPPAPMSTPAWHGPRPEGRHVPRWESSGEQPGDSV